MPALNPNPRAIIVSCDCGCGVTFYNLTPHGRPRRWASRKCRPLSERSKEKKRQRERERRTKQAGRVCEYCGDNDRAHAWGSGSLLACENCRRQMNKKVCTRCGGPFYVYPHAPTKRRAGCVRRNRLGDCAELRA